MLVHAIGDLLPSAIGVALSPLPIITVILMLGTPKARSGLGDASAVVAVAAEEAGQVAHGGQVVAQEEQHVHEPLRPKTVAQCPRERSAPASGPGVPRTPRRSLPTPCRATTQPRTGHEDPRHPSTVECLCRSSRQECCLNASPSFRR